MGRCACSNSLHALPVTPSSLVHSPPPPQKKRPSPPTSTVHHTIQPLAPLVPHTGCACITRSWRQCTMLAGSCLRGRCSWTPARIRRRLSQRPSRRAAVSGFGAKGSLRCLAEPGAPCLPRLPGGGAHMCPVGRRCLARDGDDPQGCECSRAIAGQARRRRGPAGHLLSSAHTPSSFCDRCCQPLPFVAQPRLPSPASTHPPPALPASRQRGAGDGAMPCRRHHAQGRKGACVHTGRGKGVPAGRSQGRKHRTTHSRTQSAPPLPCPSLSSQQ